MRSPARALGWFSIGLGLAELLMPRKVARAAGSPNLPWVMRAYGLREIGTGVGLLTSRDPAPWLWGRVAGDALDIGTIALGLVTARRPMRTLTSLAMTCGIAYIDMKVAEGAAPRQARLSSGNHDYSMRSGFPKPVAEMRGAAKKAFASGGAAASHGTSAGPGGAGLGASGLASKVPAPRPL